MDNIDKMQYKNLRKHFQILISSVLGHDYYNMGGDVYQGDRLCCEDIVKMFLRQENELRFFKAVSAILCVSVIVLIVV